MIDRNNLYGLWPFLAAARRNGLRPIIGAELLDSHGQQAICLVKDDAGYSNLCRLLSARHCRGGFSLGTALPQYKQGLLVLSRDKTLLGAWQDKGVEVAADLGRSPGRRSHKLRRFALERAIPLCFHSDSLFCRPKDHQLHRLLRAITTGSSLSALKAGQVADPGAVLTGPEELEKKFALCPEAAGHTKRLTAACSFAGPRFGLVLPPHPGKEKAGDLLHRAAYKGARQRYGADLSEAVVERLDHELAVIHAMGFSSYFLVVRDIIHHKGIRRRICGRGSGAASLVAYVLYITNVCPLKHNLYFARFLHPGRRDPPDIDVDFAWDERDEVLADVLEQFSGRAALVSNHVLFQPRMAIRETARAYGLPEREISRITGRVGRLRSLDEVDLLDQLRRLPGLRDCDFPEPWPEIVSLASGLVGIPRHLSVHPGGVILTPEPISDYVPVEMTGKGVPVIHWEKDGAEEAGLVKIDLLGNRSLGVIRDCLANVRANNISFDYRFWQPEEDRRTRMRIAGGGTMGCFYIESPAMRLLQEKAGSGDFEQLVLQSSIIRPAANEFIREYVRRLHGGSWRPLHPLVGDVLDESYGLMVYQEDVSRVAVALAGFSEAEADGLRKVMSKKDKEKRLEDYEKKFAAGAADRGVSREVTREIWEMIMSFSGYSFCKPHSASYARVSFQAAFLKEHFPAEFMAAVLSNQGGYYSAFAYVSEARRLGLKVLPPDVNQSRTAWRGQADRLRTGLMAVSRLSRHTLKAISDKVRQRSFAGLVDFLDRVRPGEDEARALIQAGALDSLDPEGNRTVLLWNLAQHRNRRTNTARGLFRSPLPTPPPLPPPETRERLRREFKVLGFLCERHPMDLYRDRLAGTGCLAISRLREHINRRVTVAGWLICGKLLRTREGEAMEFLSFEDEKALVETTFFPRVYQRYAHILSPGRPYLLTGLVEEDYGAVTLTVEEIQRL